MRVVVAMGCLGVGSGSGDPGPEMGALGGCGGACGDAWWRPSRGVRANARLCANGRSRGGGRYWSSSRSMELKPDRRPGLGVG